MGKNPGHVAVFAPSLALGGAQRAMVNIAAGMARRGIRVDLLLAEARGPFLELVPSDVRIIDFRSRPAVTSLPRLLRYVRRERPDVLLSTLNASLTALLAKRLLGPGLRVVARYENTFSMVTRCSRLRTRCSTRAVGRLLPHADAVVAVSHAAADDLRLAVPGAAHLVRTAPNPVVTPALRSQARLPVEHPWFNDPGTAVMIAVGRLSDEKDYPTLLRAAARVVRSRPARLVILGEGPRRRELTALARELGITGRVDFPGFVSNPYAYMARARVLVSSSKYEGLPAVLVEAMACGTPVVSTDCPSGPGEILEDGKLGKLTPVGDWKALANAVEETLDAPPDSETLTAKARRYSAETAVDRYLQILGACDPPRGRSRGTR